MRFVLLATTAALALAAGACGGAEETQPQPDASAGSTTEVHSERTTELSPVADLAVNPVDLGEVSHRAAHTATTLLDGAVLVAGGCVVDGCRFASPDTFVIAPDGTLTGPGPALTSARDSHTATLLPDGEVLLAGGFAGEDEAPLISTDIFVPGSTSITVGPNLVLGRGGHAAAVLDDGRVLIAGGWIGPRTYTATTEMFDPETGAFAQAPDLPMGVDALDAITLSDGRILVTGGQVQPGVATGTSAIYDPTTDAWTEVDPMLTPRFKHESVLLGDGSVLIMGGTPDDRTLLKSTEIFDPESGRFAAGPDLAEARYKLQGGAVVLESGRVIIAGGGRTIEVLDVARGHADTIDDLGVRGSFATISLLGSGDLIVIGGYDDRIDLRDEARLVRTGDT